jgi:hypothetical protein
VAIAGRFVNHPALSSHRLRRLLPGHCEAYPFWEPAFAGFAEPDRDLVAAEVTPHIRACVKDAVASVMRHQCHPRFLAEYSGWSRFGFMKAIFPDAAFVHVVRDGRAVANSLLHVDYWLGYKDVHRWQFGSPTADQAELARYGDSFVARAALNWRKLTDNIVEAAA